MRPPKIVVPMKYAILAIQPMSVEETAMCASDDFGKIKTIWDALEQELGAPFTLNHRIVELQQSAANVPMVEVRVELLDPSGREIGRMHFADHDWHSLTYDVGFLPLVAEVRALLIRS